MLDIVYHNAMLKIVIKSKNSTKLFMVSDHWDRSYTTRIVPTTQRDIISDTYLIKSDKCTIPYFEAFSPDAMEYMKVQQLHDCMFESGLTLTYTTQDMIHVNKTNQLKPFACVYTPFSFSSKPSGYVFKNQNRQHFKSEIQATHPFVMVSCEDEQNRIISKQYFSFFFKNKQKTSKKRKMAYDRKKTIRPPNILLLGIDSTSRLNYIRLMNRTRSYLRDELNTFEMSAYNKIGLNTFPNMIATLMGIPVEEAGITNYEFLDNYNYIWKTFSEVGYTTYLIEDNGREGIFNYLKKGFEFSPMDYYMRAYMILWKKLLDTMQDCDLGREQVKLMLDNILAFTNVFPDKPYFAIGFSSSVSHYNSWKLQKLDDLYFEFFREMKRLGYLDDTIVIFMSDHGSRYGGFRQTFQGRIEEHLPLLSISLPERFTSNFPEFENNLHGNSYRLTNNFDIYATFLHIIDIVKGNKERTKPKYGISLFSSIHERSCDEIHIPPQFCTCGRMTAVDLSDSLVLHASDMMIVELNRITEPARHLCRSLSLEFVTYASKSSLTTTHGNEHVDYTIGISVMPSFGKFEALFRHFKGQDLQLLGTVLRTDRYSHQSQCLVGVTNAVVIERICMCKSFQFNKKNRKFNILKDYIEQNGDS